MVGQRIEAQRLNRRIAVLRRGPGSDDGYGKAPGELRRLCWRFASVKPVARRAQFEAGGQAANAELSAWLRWDDVTSGIKATDQVSFDGRLFEIVGAPMEVGRRGGIELMLIAADVQAGIDPAGLPAWA